jgi:hypothetical protein
VPARIASACARGVSSVVLSSLFTPGNSLLPVAWPNGHIDRYRYVEKTNSDRKAARSRLRPAPCETF